jgi:hypothetical protein
MRRQVSRCLETAGHIGGVPRSRLFPALGWTNVLSCAVTETVTATTSMALCGCLKEVLA